MGDAERDVTGDAQGGVTGDVRGDMTGDAQGDVMGFARLARGSFLNPCRATPILRIERGGCA